MTFANIIIILECVILIINVGTVIYKLIKPAIKIQDRIEALENHNMEDSVRIYKLEELSVDQSKILIQMLDRMTGSLSKTDFLTAER
ncbi:MAG: hypothetical protein IJC41_06205 [Firmicutes bacterium]|nr:hypothetical protein [Bacillota bacterium]